jgi:hypothetical protein
MEVPNSSDEKLDKEEHKKRYPPQKDYHEYRKFTKPADGLELEVGQCINDIPFEERHHYMWNVPDSLKDHPRYKEKDYDKRIIRECEEKKCCEENEKKKKEKDKDDAIQLLLKHVSVLTEQVNELTKQMNSKK